VNILFISTLNLATNPRLFKEAQFALQEGHKVQIICFEFDNWSYDFNQQLKINLAGALLIILPGNRKPLFPWAVSVFLEKFYRVTGKFIKLSDKNLSQAVSRRSSLLLGALKKSRLPVDLVIGHNPGALYPVLIAAKKMEAVPAFDIEDYHPGEGKNKHEQSFTKELISRTLPRMKYVSFAAPLILKRTAIDIRHTPANWIVLLNYFNSGDFDLPVRANDGPLKLVWFSQNINHSRGLEQLMPGLAKFKNDIKLTVIGNRKDPFCAAYIDNNEQVSIMPPLAQKELHKMISEFDVGLAIEPGKDKNNFIALSNKLITYFQSGIYILATDTPAHKLFFERYSLNGSAVSLNENDEVEDVLRNLLSRIDTIRSQKLLRFEEAKKYCWETESKKLSDIWKTTQ
jgi:hypothetical protein